MTAWSTSGSLVSDRIPPPSKQLPQIKGKGRKVATPEPPKSSVVRVLEARLDGARTSNGRTKDPKGGCFCQARTHALSSYVSMCSRCGLILCILNPPYHACPHCTAPLLEERERMALVARIEEELAEQLAKEEMERQRVIEEARAAEGAFPTLPGPQGSTQIARTSLPTTRTVLSLNSQTKKVTVSSYGTQTSRPASRGEDKEVEGRVPGPPEEVSHVKERPDPARPWRDVRAGDVRYVPIPGGTTGGTSQGGGRKKGKKRGTSSGMDG